MSIRPSFPQNYQIVDKNGNLTQQWQYFLRTLTSQLPDPSKVALQTSTCSITAGDLTPILDPIYVNISGDSMTGGLSVPSLTIAGTSITFPLSTSIGGTGLTSLGTSNQILGVNTIGSGLEYKSLSSGSGITVTPSVGTISISNTGVLSNIGGTGISLSGSTGNITISNTGVTNISNGSGIGVSGSTGSITISNTGVTSLTAGSGISVSGSTGNITISSTGGGTGTVTSVAATVPSFLSISGSPITTSGTLAIGLSGIALPVLNGGTGLTSLGTANQIIGVNTGGTTNEYKTISGSTGLTVTPSAGNITLTNTGVTSLVAGSNITLSGSTGAVTISSTGGSISGSGQISLNLGSFPGSNEGQVTVTGLAGISSTATCFAKINGDSTSVDFSSNDHRYLAGFLNLSCSTATTGSGFTIYSTSLEKISGIVTVDYFWQN